MERTSFFNPEKISNQLNFRKKTTDGNKVEFAKIRWIRLRKETPNVYQYKFTLSDIEGWKTVDLTKTNRKVHHPAPHNISLRLLYESPKPIKAAKKKDLLELCQFIPMTARAFYENLKADDNAEDEQECDLVE